MSVCVTVMEDFNLKEEFHFAFSQVKTINGLLGSISIVLIIILYVTRALPLPWCGLKIFLKCLHFKCQGETRGF